MDKLLHYIKEDYTGAIEKLCFESFKKTYPDYKIMAWKPGSSPIRILYDKGGLFIGPNILVKKALPEKYFEKPFLMFDNRFETTSINLSLCYSEKGNPLFLRFMEDKFIDVLYEQGFDNRNKLGLADKEMDLKNIRVLDRFTLGFDKAYYELYDSCFLDTNVNFEEISDVYLHYLIADKKTSSKELFFSVDGFLKSKYPSEEKHFILLINNGADSDLISKIGTLLVYSKGNENRQSEIINLGGCSNISEMVFEYIGRKFNRLKCCERVM